MCLALLCIHTNTDTTYLSGPWSGAICCDSTMRSICQRAELNPPQGRPVLWLKWRAYRLSNPSLFSHSYSRSMGFCCQRCKCFGGVTCLWNIVAWISFIQMACTQPGGGYEVMFENMENYGQPSRRQQAKPAPIHVFTLVSEKSDFFRLLFVVQLFNHGFFAWLVCLKSFVCCWWSVKANRPPLCKEANN